jgi:hypothetical protein
VTKTLNSPLSSAELCRQNGWQRGTFLVGEEDGEIARVRITAVGEEEVLALDLKDEVEDIWDLRYRAWRRK